ncbi:Activin_recp domain-containing protein [Caenorhabditis elegans]|uniref:Activin_recp domain-containing protein n=1 Tax=Caenorhabditis elegans TaxID=6239 RepID=Q7K7C1_CAEEL|nr:Activin_recp domain-containing protein [Caenorhabditis elegans]CAE54927.1 Activin_recp domain-containing protein [Caenorhabditis elegans]|eukprot:NP_001021706.1 Uncharacterized protein CELE_Y106G6D.8 [Caenorhabditis elegans]
MISCRFLIFLSLLVTVFSLECYTGFTYLKAQSVGTSKETCPSPNDYCYNMTADLTSLNNVKKGGCSSTRCILARNKCMTQSIGGTQIQFCCCNTGDLCNSKLTNMSFFEKTKQRAKDFLDMLRG